MSRRILSSLLMSATIVATPAAAEWQEASTEHFLIYADASESWLRNYATDLEKFVAALRKLQPQTPAQGMKSNRPYIFVLPTVERIQRLYSDRPNNVAGFYSARTGHSVAFVPADSGSSSNVQRSASASSGSDRGNSTLKHEYTHHFMALTSGRAYPLWFSEGVAELFGTTRVAANGSVEIGRANEGRAYQLFNTSMKVQDLLNPPKSFDGDQFYGRSWALTHMLLFSRDRAGQLDKYLALLNSGKSSLDAAREAFGDLGKLQADLDNYTSRQLSVSVIPANMIKTGPIEIRKLTPGEAAMMPIRIRSERGVDEKAADALVPEARARAAAYPNDAAAQTALAEAEFDAGNLKEAEAAADRAIAADPKAVDALLYKGWVLQRRAADGAPDAAALRKAARGWFVKANKVDSDAAEPLEAYYESFSAAGERPSAAAVAGLERAFEVSPQSNALRFAVARQYLSEGDGKTAKALLAPLAYGRHGGGSGNLAQRMIDALDAGKSPRDVLMMPSQPPKTAPGGD